MLANGSYNAHCRHSAIPTSRKLPALLTGVDVPLTLPMHVGIGYISGFALKAEGEVGQQAASRCDELTLLPVAAGAVFLTIVRASGRASSHSSRALATPASSLAWFIDCPTVLFWLGRLCARHRNYRLTLSRRPFHECKRRSLSAY